MQAAAAVRHRQLLAPPDWCRYAGRRRRSIAVRMAPREDGPSVAIVGATGAVAQEFLRVITDRDFPHRSLRLLASERSAGKRFAFEDREYTVQDFAAPEAFDGVDIALFSAGGGVSRMYGPAAVASERSARKRKRLAFEDRECTVQDLAASGAFGGAGRAVRRKYGPAWAVTNSFTFLMDSEVPLVIPEVSPQVLRMVVSTYQAARGAGAAVVEELKRQTKEVWEGKAPICKFFKQQYAFNIFSHNAPVLENGYNEEEMKMVKETRKIWNDKDVKVTATCIRVPVMREHSVLREHPVMREHPESVNLQFENDEDTAREILRAAPGVTIVEVSDKNGVAMGRILQDLSQVGNRGFDIQKAVFLVTLLLVCAFFGFHLFFRSSVPQLGWDKRCCCCCC